MFKEGEQIVAIIDDLYLTKGKIYTSKYVSKDGNSYIVYLEVDDGIEQWYDSGDFISLLEYRKLKIEKIKYYIKNYK